MAKDRDYGDRPSWSEIDKRRDGRSGGGKASGGLFNKGREPNRYQQKQMDKRFDALFTNPEQDAALQKLREHFGKNSLVEVFAEYQEAHGFPEAYDVLAALLEEHPEVAVKVEALTRMEQRVDEEADSTQQVFKSRVKLLRMTAREADLKKAAARICKLRKY